MSSHSRLPTPDSEALAHSRRLVEVIRAEMVEGFLGFPRYMELALYAPGLGYYSAGSTKLGPEGDFVTAPELSPLFGRCLARSCAEVLAACGGGDILELGAGSGALATDVLLELERMGTLPERYSILEVSGDLRARQERTLAERVPHLLEQVCWLDALPHERLRGVVLANEVLDALPVDRFRIADGGILELGVGWAQERLVWAERPAGAALTRAVAALQDELPAPLPPRYTSELRLDLAPWIGAFAGSLAQGALLFIDYGYPRAEYYLPERSAGTLQCHYRHRAHPDPLILTGLQDITAHVDFTAVAEAGVAAGLALDGYTTQAHFLLASGLPELAAEADHQDLRAQLETARQVRLLTLPGEMGERFQVMVLARGLEQPLAGFRLRDLRGRL